MCPVILRLASSKPDESELIDVAICRTEVVDVSDDSKRRLSSIMIGLGSLNDGGGNTGIGAAPPGTNSR